MLGVLHSVQSAVAHESRRRGETAQRSLADHGPSHTTHPLPTHTHPHPPVPEAAVFDHSCQIPPRRRTGCRVLRHTDSAARRRAQPRSRPARSHHPWSPDFRIAFVLFWCSWLLRGHGAGGEVEGGKVKPCSPANLASCARGWVCGVGGRVINISRHNTSSAEESKSLALQLTISAQLFIRPQI